MSVVLTVDDSDIEHVIYSRLLASAGGGGVEHVRYSNSAEALAWAASHDLDLVIVDYNMPAPNGLEFIEQLRGTERHRDTPIVMITADMEHDVRYRALELGTNDFLNKPIDRVEFIARARNMLKLSHHQKELAGLAHSLAGEVERATHDIILRERETIYRLTRAAEFRDTETGMHIVRMGMLCALIALELKYTSDECEMLSLAAPMHDIGKVAIPDRILLKAGPLTPDEWAIMKQHTTFGYEILKGSDSPLLELGGTIALAHHERFDGGGYPNGLSGEAIPEAGRICTVSDVFDALTSKRPYKEAWPVERAIEYIEEGSGTLFDPKVVAAFHTALAAITEVKSLYADPVETTA